MRSWSSVLLTAVLSFRSVNATPLKVAYADEHPSEHAHRLHARDLGDFWPGLNWQTASHECTSTQLVRLQVAVYDAVTIGRAAFNSHLSWDGPFEQLFNSGWGRTSDTQSYVQDIWQNMNASITYPRVGDPKGRFRQAYQLSIRCKETLSVDRCGVPGRRVVAYVIQGSGETGPQVTFCPDFFDSSIRGAPKELNALYHSPATKDLASLLTTGQLVLHEFMHVQTFGHCEKIVDLKADLPSLNGAVGSVYGLSRCEEFAHINGDGIPNPKVTTNADNYAWWASGMYWGKKYGITPSKFRIRADTTGDMSGDDSANPNGGFAYDDSPDDPSYQPNAADFTAPAPIDIAECSIDVSNPDQPSISCDGQNNDIPGDPAVDDQILNLTPTAAAPPSYATGWCGMHIVQYQKNEEGDPAHPSNPEYVVEVSLFDAKQNPIPLKNCNGCGNTASSVALNGKANYIESDLPYGMLVTVGAVDDDAILFAYAGQFWGSNDQQHYSNFGPYDNGKRQGDTGFTC